MRKILTLFIAQICLLSFSQTNINKDFIECKILYDSGKIQNAYECYAESENSIFANYMCAILADSLNNKKLFDMHYKNLTSRKTRTPLSYKYSAILYKSNPKKYIKVLDKGIRLFKNDTSLLKMKVKYYLPKGDDKKLIKTLNQLIKRTDASDTESIFARACAFDNSNNKEKAIDDYKKAIKLDSMFFDAYFNLAVLHYNEAVKLYRIANNQTDYKLYEKYLIPAENKLRLALPYFERAHEIKPTNKIVLQNLKKSYFRLKMNIEYESIKMKLGEE